eukprot:gnl/TRDRNA2_/TRDRNA2_180116_c0_seq1.p1 gnl/TRDRNA2_/TRDRNA2_180116_c0~~gnl/TRDRNA2_/TRDRNA2_180116_c0_seq1.p1  ORF type:complete len:283 (-),score=48.79 gnl/TRDRNA2_/TRDRNA2_180116_c0_seq1:121-969(-)
MPLYEPRLAGIPITIAQNLVCFANLIANVVIIAQVRGSKMTVWGVDISPTALWANATFFAVGIVALVCAGSGILFRIEDPITVYVWYLVATIGVEIMWFVIFCVYGSECKTSWHQDMQATVRCGLSNASFIVVITVLVLVTILAVWISWQARVFVRSLKNAEMLPYLKQSLQSELATKDEDDARKESKRLAKSIQSQYGSMPAALPAAPVSARAPLSGRSTLSTSVGGPSMPVSRPYVPSSVAVPRKMAQTMPPLSPHAMVNAVPSGLVATSLPAAPLVQVA